MNGGQNLRFLYWKRIVVLALTGIPIGLLVGLVEGIFGRGLLLISGFFQAHKWMLVTLPLTGCAIVYLFSVWGKPAAGKMNLIFEVDQDKKDHIPKRLATLMIVSTWLTHLSGGSAGKEGVAVQVGATLSDLVRRVLHSKEDASIFLVTGMAAGFAGLFQTPFSAVFFALEVLAAGSLRYAALPSSLTAAFCATGVCHLLGLSKGTISVLYTHPLDIKTGLLLVVMGLLFGLCGELFATGLKWGHKKAGQLISNPYKRIVLGSLVLMVFLYFFHDGRYAGLSPQLIADCFAGKTYWYDWLAKLVLTVGTLAIGFQGGEVTPLYTVGSALGAVLAPLLGLPSPFGAMLGYAAVFAAGTNTFLAAILLGMEVFGWAYFPYFFIVVAVAWLSNRNISIYSLQQVTYRKQEPEN